MQRKIIPYNIHLKELARKLRNSSTPGEIALWNEIKNKKLGYDFHRQKPLLNYIADFYSPELELVIEIDGRYHEFEGKFQSDVDRDTQLKVYNLHILRFSEIEVVRDMLNVLRTITTYIAEHEARTHPL